MEICDTFSGMQIFISMTKKTKHVVLRITEDQFRKLADAIIDEEENKSTIIRTALDHYLAGTDRSRDNYTQKHNKNKKSF